MKKQSLIHVHALLVQIRNDLHGSGEDSEHAFDEYDQFDVSPTSVHKGKDYHLKAIRLLLDGIREILDTHEERVIQ